MHRCIGMGMAKGHDLGVGGWGRMFTLPLASTPNFRLPDSFCTLELLGYCDEEVCGCVYAMLMNENHNAKTSQT